LTSPTPAKSDALVERIRPILAGQSPEVVGAALADLLAILLAGYHPPEVRQPLLDSVLDLTWNLVRFYDDQRRLLQ
jgi:hypothetical protein